MPEYNLDALDHLASRVCNICESMEFKDSVVVRNEVWICKECRSILKEIVMSKKAANVYRENGIMKNHD